MIFLGLDIGSTGCKCVAFLDNGDELAAHYCEYPTTGQADLDPKVLRSSVLSNISLRAKVENRTGHCIHYSFVFRRILCFAW